MSTAQPFAVPGGRSIAGALFLVALATVMFEILLTRIFSLTLWYHFGFMAISVAMFGMTVGALLVFLRPQRWPAQTLGAAMGRCAIGLALAMAGAIFLHVYIFLPNPYSLPLVWTFLCTAVPFVFSGVFVSLALTRFPSRVARLYAVDLAGAALGCLAVVAALKWLDGIGAVLACAALAAVAGGALLAARSRALAILIVAVLAGAATWSGVRLARNEVAGFAIRYAKGTEQGDFDYERWNSFSRITVVPQTGRYAVAWSLSAAYRGALDVPNRWLQIDSGAGTQLVGFQGDLKTVDFLRWDLVNFGQRLRQGSRVCIIGAGGGRDVLTAKLFGQKHVLAMEINPDIMRVVNGRFGEFTGHLDRDPNVALVNDEARSYLTRSAERCDLIQLTFIDTWAATAAGAYVLAENTLYTIEAWRVYLDRLGDDGLLAVARGVGPELGRLVSLGRATLAASGAREPQRHMMLIVNRRGLPPKSYGPMGMLLLRKTPFPDEEVRRVRAEAAKLQFDVRLEPGGGDAFLRALASDERASLAARDGLNYEAPTDDRPFFFNMQRFSAGTLLHGGQHPVALLMNLLFGVLALTIACILVPLAMARIARAPGDGVLLAFFAAIGGGFMLIEVSMLQRLVVFLGHPTYSLTVILFVLLLAAGAGSRLCDAVPDARMAKAGTVALAIVVAVLGAAGAALPALLHAFQAAQTSMRIAVASGVLAAMGLVMGMAFPLGMRVAMSRRAALAPWLWGVNGATSVLASVLAICLATTLGISAGFWAGVTCYVVALAAFARAARPAA